MMQFKIYYHIGDSVWYFIVKSFLQVIFITLNIKLFLYLCKNQLGSVNSMKLSKIQIILEIAAILGTTLNSFTDDFKNSYPSIHYRRFYCSIWITNSYFILLLHV